MKKTVTLILGLLVVVGLGGIVWYSFFQAEEARKEPLKISINVWPGYAHAFIAQEKGYFEKNNVSVELLLKDNISASTELYRNGDADGLYNVFPDILMLNAEGIATKVVYIADYSDTGDEIIGKPEFDSLTDLAHKKVSFEGVNSFSHIFVLRAMLKAGVDENDIQLANIPAMDVLTALEEGKIEAGHTWEPITSQATEKGYKILAKAGDVPGIIIDLLAFHEKIIRERPDDVRAIVQSMLEAKDFLDSNRDEALAIMAKSLGMSLSELKEGIDGVNHLNLQENVDAMQRSTEEKSMYNSGEFIMDFLAKRGQLSTKMNLDDIIEARFVNELSISE